MKLSSSRKTFLCNPVLIAVLLIAVSELARSAEVPNTDDLQKVLNVDLNHLISILNGTESDEGLLTTSPNHVIPPNNVDDQYESSTSPLPLPPTKKVIIKKLKFRKIRKYPTTLPPQTTTTESTFTEIPPTISSTTTTNTLSPPPSTTPPQQPPLDIVSSTIKPTRRTTAIPIVKVSNFPIAQSPDVADRREDINVDDIAPPSQVELAQQLSLLNSLLTSLADNATANSATTSESPLETTTPVTTTTEHIPPSIPNDDSNSNAGPTNEQTLAVLNSIFGGGAGINENVLGSSPSSSSPDSNVATRQVPLPAIQIEPGTEGAKALSEFLFQAAAIEAAQRGNNNPQNPQNPQNLNHISSLVSLLGTLNAISPQNGGNPLQGLQAPTQGGVNQGFQQSQITDPQQVLAILAAQQNQFQQQSGQPNSLTDLFSQVPPNGVGQPSFDLGNLLAQAQGGGGILSTIGSGITSLGSSMFSTFSNLLSGSGIGGKPRVRGVDTRLGLGYRFGDAADAQIMWDVGPQLFTEPVRNEQRSPTIARKSHTVVDNQETEHLIRSLIGGDKPKTEGQGLFAAAKRVLQLQTKKLSPHNTDATNNPPNKKPFSLLDVWNAGKEPKLKPKLIKPKSEQILQIPHQLLTPPIALELNEADRHQMARNKNFKKRSSSHLYIPAPLKNYYSKPDDDPLSGHSTLTAYEQMLITQGKDIGTKFRKMMMEKEQERLAAPTTGQPTMRSRKRPLQPNPTQAFVERQDHDEEDHDQLEQLPTAEYGNNAGLSESALTAEDEEENNQKKKFGRGKKNKRNKKKRPVSSMRPRPLKLNDQYKWKPRIVVEVEGEEEDEDSQDGEIHHRDEQTPRSKEQIKESTPKKRPQGQTKSKNKSHERDSVGQDHTHDDDTPCSREAHRNKHDDKPPTSHIEPESSHSLSRPQINDDHHHTEELDDDEEVDEDDFRSQSKPSKNYEEGDYDEQDPTTKPYNDVEYTIRKRPKSSKEKNRSSIEKYRGSKEKHSQEGRKKDIRPYNDDDERPRHKDKNKGGRQHIHFKYNPRPTPKKPQKSILKQSKKSPPKFSLARIFHYWMGTGRRPQKVKKSKQQPSSERGHRNKNTEEDYDYERFTYHNEKPESRSDDPFSARNRRRKKGPRRRRPLTSTLLHKISSVSTPLKRIGSSSNSSPYDFIQTYSPINPEANDSFLRRNQVNKKLIQAHQSELQSANSGTSNVDSTSSGGQSPTTPTKTSPSSVMTFVKNYFASKTSKNPSTNNQSKNRRPPSYHHQQGNGGSPHSISTLAKLISNPSSLNPLKMLPSLRKNRIRPTQPSATQPTPLPQGAQIRHKIAVINGKLQIINVTVTTTEPPIIHVGDDMSFEELTQVLSSLEVKNKRKKAQNKKKNQKIQTTTTSTTTKRPMLSSKKDYDYEDDDDMSEEEPADFVVKAEKKVDQLPANKDKTKNDEVDDVNDGLKGIFIDIESGEVNVMKPVASLTSFQPVKEEAPPTLQEVLGGVDAELDDEDGDGVADKEIQRKEEIFSGIQSELKRNYDQMKKAHELAEEKKRRKQAYVDKGLDESLDVVSKYFDVQEDQDDNEGGK